MLSANVYVDIYRDFLTQETLFCKTLSESKDLVCVTKYNDHGEYDGISIIYKSDITRLRLGGTERNMIERLIARQSHPLKLPHVRVGTLESTIRIVNKMFNHVTLYLERMDSDVCFIGELQSIDQTHVFLREYGSAQQGLDRSQILLPLELITRIEADGKYERDLLFLHKQTDKQ